MKTLVTTLYIIFFTAPYIALEFLVNTLFGITDYPLWVTIGILLFGLLSHIGAVLILQKEEKDKSE